jgi:hypothetical protein
MFCEEPPMICGDDGQTLEGCQLLSTSQRQTPCSSKAVE